MQESIGKIQTSAGKTSRRRKIGPFQAPAPDSRVGQKMAKELSTRKLLKHRNQPIFHQPLIKKNCGSQRTTRIRLTCPFTEAIKINRP